VTPVNHLTATDAALAALASGRNRDPFGVLGPHVEGGDTVIRAFHPSARSIDLRLVATGELRPMARRGGTAGAFEIRLTASAEASAVKKPDATYALMRSG